MKVRVVEGRKGDPVAHIENYLCLFDQKTQGVLPEIGSEVEVMITSVVFPKNGHGNFDYSRKPSMLLIRTIDEDTDVLIKHKGFEMLPNSCSELASVISAGKFYSVSPGRLHTAMYIADNVSNRKVKLPLVPGSAYIKINAGFHRSQGVIRIEGVPDLECLRFWVEENNPQVRWVMAERSLSVC